MTDPNPNRIPNRKLSLLEMAENGGPFRMAALRNGGPSEWRADTGESEAHHEIE